MIALLLFRFCNGRYECSQHSQTIHIAGTLATVKKMRSTMETNKDLSPWISGVFVVSEYCGKGIGGLLVDKLEQIASDFGFEKLYWQH